MSLPGILSEIAEIAGEASAVAIADLRGGTQVYFPPVPGDDHWLCHLIGRDKALRVCDRLTCGLAGRRVDLPLGPTGAAARIRAKVDAMLGDDCSDRDIARATGYTTRGIQMRRKKLGIRRSDGQLSLF